MKELPADVGFYRKTGVFADTAVPPALLKDHRLAEGVWGRIIVLEGTVTYVIEEPEHETVELTPSKPGIVEPGVAHHLIPAAGARFCVEFHAVPAAPDAYGNLDASYRAAGEEAGIRRLCDDFYHFMGTLPEAAHIRAMHREDLATITDKLTLFLCGWLGGPRKYSEKYGPIHIPMAHRHLVINEPERDVWLLCMQKAVDRQPWAEDFKRYFMAMIAMPAEKVRLTSRNE